ncbi:MAG: 16S rRNA (adenine(1518)-N(6)/adenine(1519)-N(6))-dimethyltransferase [Epulopiscium sp. Nuni2H_MBin003]|nr:MAG: 16S rRNA (adenine(1518)-N(6)/adenine(1519)-N(6))-dimethyltransferase [Epulopiscium sp. Nuni2H_MBin003]
MKGENVEQIATPKGTKAVLNKYPIMMKKRYGQNFLIDPHVLSKIIASANITEDDCVIEIGPGIGSVTEELVKKAKKVIAIEIDKDLIPILNDQFGKYDNFILISSDVLKINMQELIEKEASGLNVKVVANLPYYITTPIIMMLLENELPLSSITVMVQKEVADRIVACPASKEYGAITASVSYYSAAEIVANVPQNCFMPRPNVTSAVIKLTLYKEPPVNVEDKPLFFNIIKASFAQRRKTLLNTLYSNITMSITKEELREILDNSGIGATARGETLGINEFAYLTELLKKGM